MKHRRNVHFVSELDKFSEEFNRSHPLSESQKAEIAKYQAIYRLRDIPQKNNEHQEVAD